MHVIFVHGDYNPSRELFCVHRGKRLRQIGQSLRVSVLWEYRWQTDNSRCVHQGRQFVVSDVSCIISVIKMYMYLQLFGIPIQIHVPMSLLQAKKYRENKFHSKIKGFAVSYTFHI